MGQCRHLAIFPGGRSTLSTVVGTLRNNSFQFQIVAVRHLDFNKLEILTAGPVQRANMRHQAKFRADRSNCCGDMADFRFFKMSAVRHLGFVLHVFEIPTKST